MISRVIFISILRLRLAEVGPCIFHGDRDSLLDTAKRIQRWSNVQREDRIAMMIVWEGIIIDDIANFFAGDSSSYNPVVTIEGRIRAVSHGQNGVIHSHNDYPYLNREGNTRPASMKKRAFGENWPGFPWKRASCKSLALRKVINLVFLIRREHI